MYQQQKLRTRSEPLLPMHLAASSDGSSSSSSSSSPALPGVSPSSGRRRRIPLRRSLTQEAGSPTNCHVRRSATFRRNNNNNNNTRRIRRSSTFTKQETQQLLLEADDDQLLVLPQYHLMQPQQSPPSKRATRTISTGTPATSPKTPLARIYSGTAVAGFVLGTIFEVGLIGWMACLHVKGTCADDPLLFRAFLGLFLVGSWSSIFHYVLWQMDAIFTDLTPPGTVVNRWWLYGHFNIGLLVGLGLECTVLHHVLMQRQSRAAILFLTPQCGWSLQSVSIVFGLGVFGLTLIRTYFTPDGGKKLIKRKQSAVLDHPPITTTTTSTTPLMARTGIV